MITAYLTLCIMAFGPQSCWPERAIGQFDTSDECWAAIGDFMHGKPAAPSGPIQFTWRCGENT